MIRSLNERRKKVHTVIGEGGIEEELWGNAQQRLLMQLDCEKLKNNTNVLHRLAVKIVKRLRSNGKRIK